MNNFLLKFRPTIIELERENRWNTIIKTLYSEWSKDPSDLNLLLCAGTETWYAMLVMEEFQFYDTLPKTCELVQQDVLAEIFSKIQKYGESYFPKHPAFLAYFGYMTKVKPFLFNEFDGNYDGWVKKGKHMMRQAYKMCPSSLFAKAMFYETFPQYESIYYQVCQKLWDRWTPEQWGSSEVQRYFFRILNGDQFYPNAYSAS